MQTHLEASKSVFHKQTKSFVSAFINYLWISPTSVADTLLDCKSKGTSHADLLPVTQCSGSRENADMHSSSAAVPAYWCTLPGIRLSGPRQPPFMPCVLPAKICYFHDLTFTFKWRKPICISQLYSFSLFIDLSSLFNIKCIYLQLKSSCSCLYFQDLFFFFKQKKKLAILFGLVFNENLCLGIRYQQILY